MVDERTTSPVPPPDVAAVVREIGSLFGRERRRLMHDGRRCDVKGRNCKPLIIWPQCWAGIQPQRGASLVWPLPLVNSEIFRGRELFPKGTNPI